MKTYLILPLIHVSVITASQHGLRFSVQLLCLSVLVKVRTKILSKLEKSYHISEPVQHLVS